MEITVVSSESERSEMLGVIDAYGRMEDGKMSKTDFNANVPTKVYIDYRKGECNPWLVVDNRDGDCFTEDFATLDGAMLYATDCHLTAEGVEKWDRQGAADENLGFVHCDEDDDEEWPDDAENDKESSDFVKVRVHDIEWDTDGKRPPTDITAEIDADWWSAKADAIAEWLYIEYGLRTLGFSYEVV